MSAFLSLSLIFSSAPLYALPIPSHPTNDCKKYQSETECMMNCLCIWSNNQVCLNGDNKSAPCIQAKKEVNIIFYAMVGLIGLSAGYFIYKLFCQKLLPTADDYSVNEYGSV